MMDDEKRWQRIVFWVCLNGLLIGGLWLWLAHGSEGARNIAYFIAWAFSIASLGFLSDEVRIEVAKRKPSVPHWLNSAVDTGILLTFVYMGSFVTAAIWAVHMVLSIGGIGLGKKEAAKAG